MKYLDADEGFCAGKNSQTLVWLISVGVVVLVEAPHAPSRKPD